MIKKIISLLNLLLLGFMLFPVTPLFAAETNIKVDSDTPTSYPQSKWAAGLLYPGGSIKYSNSNYAWEFKAQSGSGVLALGPRYYRYLNTSGLRLFWGLEVDFISFKGKASKGSGWAAGGFVGGELPITDQLGLAMDFGPMLINLTEKDYSQSENGLEYVVGLGVYWHFK